MARDRHSTDSYEAPRLEVLGTVKELTLGGNKGAADGVGLKGKGS